MNRDDEIEAFKGQINLSEFAASMGYQLDRKASSRNCCVMKDQSGDKVIVGMAPDRHWIYYSVFDDTDNGSIVDFVQNRGGGNLGQVRQPLRPWLSGSHTPVSSQDFLPSLEPITKDLLRVSSALAAMEPCLSHGYLQGRGLSAALLSSDRFAGKVLSDARGNAIFPHRNQEGFCGWEAKNQNFTGFAPGGEKGLWFSRVGEGDTSLVIAETAIDALSHATLKPDTQARYCSTGGALNPAQPGLLRAAMEKLPPGSKIILAFDNDQAGHALAEQLSAVFADLSDAGKELLLDMPSTTGQDWNDTLRASMAEEGAALTPD